MTASFLWRGTRQDRDRAAALLAQGFAHDPAMAYFAMGDDPVVRRAVCDALVRMHVAGGQDLWFWSPPASSPASPVAVALIERQPTLWRQVVGLVGALRAFLRLPAQTRQRLNAYARLARPRPMPRKTLYLVMVAVDPAHRGAGHGGAFLAALERAHGADYAWALDTENDKNLGLYRHLGYDLKSEGQLGPLTIFRLFRPAREVPLRENKP